VTVVLVDPDADRRCLPEPPHRELHAATEPAAVGAPYVELVDQARRHRPVGREELCGADECARHWPCPSYFQARLALIRAGVDPVWWAAPLPAPGWATPGGGR